MSDKVAKYYVMIFINKGEYLTQAVNAVHYFLLLSEVYLPFTSLP